MKPRIFYTNWSSVHTKPANSLIHPGTVRATNMRFQKKKTGLVWTWPKYRYLRDLVTVPLIRWLSPALKKLQEKEISLIPMHTYKLINMTIRAILC